MNFQDFENEITLSRNSLVEKSEEYIKQYSNLWKSLPYLSFMVDGLLGWSGQRQKAYRSKMWDLSSAGGSSFFIDLNNPQFCDYDGNPIKNKDYIASYIFQWPQVLNIHKIVNELINDIKNGPSEYTELTALEKHRNSIDKYNLFIPKSLLIFL